MSFRGKTYWIIGASEGLGAALAAALSQDGAKVILSARNKTRLEDLTSTLGDATALPMDVTDTISIAHAAEQASHCDGIIYCAGAYEPMNAAHWDAIAVSKMTAVNYTGAVHILGHIAPKFAARGKGHIVLIGSLAAFRGLPDAIGYSASKAALVSLGESLYADLAPRGVKVQIASPGFIKTRLTDKNAFDMPQIMSPENAAQHVMRAMRSNRLHTAFPRPFSWLFSVGRLLPAKLFYRVMRPSEKPAPNRPSQTYTTEQ